jgi:Flp pilus assembly CpaF family ATPase
MDYGLVQRLRSQVAEMLRTERRGRAERGELLLSNDEERELGRSLILEALTNYRREQLLGNQAAMPPAEEDRTIAEAVHAAMFGLGRLQPLIEDPALNNIEINGCDRVWLYRTDGRIEAGPPVADSDTELIEWVRTAATYAGLSSRPFDPVHPWLEVRLPDGSRLCALMSVVERPVVSIRLYRQQRVTLEDLRQLDAFTDEVLAFLTAAVHGRCNLMVSGETFVGKTTLLRALGNTIPFEERLVTAEHFLELGFHHLPDLHRDVVAMEERLSNAEGVGAMTLLELVERSRRMNPDRIIVGEVIGGEIVAMLDAMTQGEDGSLSTIHARDSKMVFQRIATYALTSTARLPVEASGMLTSGALDFVIHLSKTRTSDGRIHRFVSSIREVVGWDGSQVISSEVFASPATGGPAVAAAPISERRAAALGAHGYDQRLAVVRS